MANKSTPKKWNDIQIAIATISMASTFVFWNMFAGPDRASAAKRAQEQAAIPPQPIVTAAEPIVAAQSIIPVQPTPLGDGKILFGGSAPQTQIIVQTGGRNGGGSGGGGGGVTSTRSS